MIMEEILTYQIQRMLDSLQFCHIEFDKEAIYDG